nr:uncharacterized protein LOC125423976 [Ziziphus jujuba var. spinosa]
MENVDHIQHHFTSDVLPSIEETRPQLKGSSFRKETMENVDRFRHLFNANVSPSIEETRPKLLGSSLLKDMMENLHIQHHFISDVSPSIEVARPQIIADDTTRGIATNFFKDVKHFTNLVRKSLCPTDPMFSLSQPAQPNQPLCSSYSQTNTYVNYNGMKDPSVHYTTCFYSAKQLDRAGVSFVPYKNQHLTNVVVKKFMYKFFPWKSLELVVPELKVVDNTECLMRNVMALEQCLYPFQYYISYYILLLDHLINTAEDVELLVEKRIVDNLLGSNEAVADLVNKLKDQLVVSGTMTIFGTSPRSEDGRTDRTGGEANGCRDREKSAFEAIGAAIGKSLDPGASAVGWL